MKITELEIEQATAFYRKSKRRSHWGAFLEILAALLFLLFVGLLLIGVFGCRTQLDPAGVYHGDKFLFLADKTIGDAGDSLNQFVTWELQNRARLTNKLHSITVAADAIRVNSPLWFTNAVNARNVYSNSVALVKGPATISAASNALHLQITQLNSQKLSAQALQSTQ